MNQYFFDDKYFNFQFNGLNSTTWTWDELLKHHPDGLLVFNWMVYPKTKEAIEYDSKLERVTGKKAGLV